MLSSCIIVVILFATIKSAKILVVVPPPVKSHQAVFRPIIQELLNREYEVAVITTEPVYLHGRSPNNLNEINLHDLSYRLWEETANQLVKKEKNNFTKIKEVLCTITKIFIEQLKDNKVVELMRNQSMKFDLLIVENFVPAALILSHFFKAPVIFMSPFGPLPGNMKMLGSNTHPFLYPMHYNKKVYNLTIWDKVDVLYTDRQFSMLHEEQERVDEKILKDLYGTDTPTLNELKNNIHMLFLNVHPIFLHNRPVPPNVVNIWNINKILNKALPKELQSFLDSSKHGVIYFSFGSVFKTSEFPKALLKIFIEVFSRLPYNILWKWDTDELPGKPENVIISKWFPQFDVLSHPNVKLFITHGGLQSTNEAIKAGVPLLGIPQFSDQEYNTEKYLYFNIGDKLDSKTLSVESLEQSINAVLTNYTSYKTNMIKLRTQMYDQPRPALEHVIWWIEYILRHGGVQHLRAPAANMSWVEYYELELVFLILSGVLALITVLLVTVYICLSKLLCLSKYKIS